VDNDDDSELVERCRQGDREAFTQLVVRYQRPIYNAAFWILRSADDAKDIAQDVFLKVAERLDEYDSHHRFFSWIYRIAVNESLNVMRRGGHEAPLDDDAEATVEDAAAGPEALVSRRERADKVRRALLQASATDRAVLTLRHFGELSYEEIANVLDIDEKTVKSRLFDARARLRERLQSLRTT
jgi:RNA polymerase sigma-70 factor (ECF subfamily)